MLVPFPNKDTIQIKEKFIERYQKLLGKNYTAFIDTSLSFNRRGIRINTLKISVSQLKKRLNTQWKLQQVPWYKDVFWLAHSQGRRDIGNTIEHALGYIYVQEPASTIPPLVLDPKPGEKVLDLCAAPGSKTTQIAQMMKNQGLIVANEKTGSRIAALGINLQRTGVTNTIISYCDGNAIDKELQFDKVLVDAPCSGTGTIRKSPKTLQMWNPLMVTRLTKTQLRLLENGYKHLKKGGTLVYSTCTLEPEENEGVISSFLEKHADIKVCDITLDIKRSEPITEFNGRTFDKRVSKTLRIYPQDNDSEGFFVCKMIKL